MSSLPGEEGRPTLYDWAGGEAALARMIDAFYDRVEADELLAPLFGGGVGVEHRDHVIAWWSEVFGGPARYSDELGGYPRRCASTSASASPRNSGTGSRR